MINRILIRIKVIQLLYSYLLIQQNFSIESQPLNPTKEKRFAHELYLDMLMLFVRLAQKISGRGGRYPLLENRFIKKLMSDDKLRTLSLKYNNVPFPYADVEDELAARIMQSAIYKEYVKDSEFDPNADVAVWKDLVKYIIFADDALWALVEQRPNYSPRAVDRMKETMESSFTSFLSSQMQIGDVIKTLRQSLDKARELYFRLLMLPVELTDLRAREIDEARHKYIVTDADRNPNLRFVENALVEKIRSDATVKEYVKDTKISWTVENPDLLAALLKAIKESDIYKDYMEFPATDLANDTEFWRNIFRYVLMDNPDFLETLEDKSVFWNDDLEIISSFVLKTFSRFADETMLKDGENPVLEMYKDTEDARFGEELFTCAVRNRRQYEDLIEETLKKADNWDTDRLAFMDMVIMITALAEILNFPKIPTSVSINEYIEMAKAYSTPKSGQFVHGVLGNIVNQLISNGCLHKVAEQ